jgi:raffinose/stachyose/melibiose transport system substrate-binding protein
MAAIAVAGCSPGSNSGSQSAPTGPASTAVAAAKVTLTLATSEAAGMTPKLIAGFEAAHPNITIKLQQASFDDYQKSINLELASSTSPDIALVNSFGTTVKDGLLLNLDSYATAYGWTNALSPSALASWRVQADGVSTGGGNLYALPGGFSVVGVYYNQAIASRLGIASPPATLADFNADLAIAKAHGVTGLEVPASSGHAAFDVQMVAQQYDSTTMVNNWIFGASGSTFNTPGVQKGAQDLAAWAKSGYLNSDANATDLTAAVAAFGSGKSLFLIDGSWDAGTINTGLGAKAGFVTFPVATAGAPVSAMSGGVAYAISARSKYPAQAAAFLNYMISAQAADGVLSSGFLPANTSTVTPPATPDMAAIVKAWTSVTETGKLCGFYASATATVNDTLTQGTEELIGGKISVSQFISLIQADWSKTHTS